LLTIFQQHFPLLITQPKQHYQVNFLITNFITINFDYFGLQKRARLALSMQQQVQIFLKEM
jgi:hypothetical protein